MKKCLSALALCFALSAVTLADGIIEHPATPCDNTTTPCATAPSSTATPAAPDVLTTEIEALALIAPALAVL